MRWSTVLKGFKQEAELFFCFRFVDSKNIKHAILNIVAVNTNGATAHLVTVAHDIVRIAHCMLWIFIELINPISRWHCKWMVHRSPLRMANCNIIIVWIICALKQWEINNPSKRKLVWVKQSCAASKLYTNCTKQKLRRFTASCCKEYSIAILRTNSFLKSCTLFFAKILSNRAF
ncbi:Uncharacterised protein [Chlamydia trachomatis]|nr:Uncharacterised protein [Chlamydia trachomatis]